MNSHQLIHLTVGQHSEVPTFIDMSFVEQAAKLANNMFGQNIGKSPNKEKSTSSKNMFKARGTTLATQSEGHSKKPEEDYRTNKNCPSSP